MDSVINIWSLLDDIISCYGREIKTKLAKLGLTITDYKILYMVNHKEMPMKCISDNLSLAKGWVTDIIDNLENKNLIMRIHNADDRRVIKIRITDDGIKKYNETKQFIKEIIKDSIEDLNENEIKSFEDILNKIDNKMKKQAIKKI
jgi:DNA-binding MarR family transcriptional regulator